MQLQNTDNICIFLHNWFSMKTSAHNFRIQFRMSVLIILIVITTWMVYELLEFIRLLHGQTNFHSFNSTKQLAKAYGVSSHLRLEKSSRHHQLNMLITDTDNVSNRMSAGVQIEELFDKSASVNVSKEEKYNLVFYPEYKRRDYPLSVLPDPYNILNEQACNETNKLTLLLLITSAAPNFSRRDFIRKTWANKLVFKNHNFRTIFVLGKPKHDIVQSKIETENRQYGDIVQGKFLDTYYNLTHKSVLGIRWASEYCKTCKAVVKADDDIFVNMFQLLEKVDNEYWNKSNEILCSVRPIGDSPIQRETGKWIVANDYFRNDTYFPIPYCRGFFSIFTPTLLPKLYEAAKETPYFWIEDVYLTGILTSNIGSVKLTNLDTIEIHEKKGLECFSGKNHNCQILAVITSASGSETMWFHASKNITNTE